MKYFIISGDYSGQMKASKLIKNISLEDSNAFFYVYGSNEMKGKNVKILYDFKHLKFMGFIDIFFKIFKIFSVLKKCKSDLIETKPDLLILIDFGGFNLPISKFAFAQKIKTVYFIPPKVWAWNEKRIKILKKNIRNLIVIFKFEYDYFKEKGLNVHYFGNPDIEEILEKTPISIREINKIALLPGSRQKEINNSLPIFEELASKNSNLNFEIAGIESLKYEFINKPNNLTIKINETHLLLKTCQFAYIFSGTASFEAAILETPHVVCFRTNIFNYLIARALIKVKYIALPNLILDKMIVKEFIQNQFVLENLNNFSKYSYYKNDYIKKNIDNFKTIKNIEYQVDSSKKIASKIVFIAKND